MNVTQSDVLVSSDDLSVNFISSEKGSIREARYVRRARDYFIVYLSSHDGCRMGCRVCHLTATKQVSFSPTTHEQYLEQARAVLAHYDAVSPEQGEAERVHYNFMARGEALANPHLLADYADIRADLARFAVDRGLTPRFNVSTIIPASYQGDLSEFDGPTRIYYSLYSMNPEFRRKWLPNAMAPERALDMLRDWQRSTGNVVVLHWAFIAGQNDDEATLREIISAIQRRGIHAKFNLVRYNPYSAAYGEESSQSVIERNFEILSSALSAPGSRIVPRVGFDVKASCGMFVEAAVE